MKRLLPLFAGLLAACAQGAKKDLPYVKQARSAAAEWALVNEQAGKGKLTDDYVTAMRSAARDELTTAQSSISDPASEQAAIVKAMLAIPDDAAPARLRSQVEALKQIEDRLESD
jgi:hypothetical protein